MSTFLVTGGGGFIGRALCAELSKHNHQVVVIDNLVSETLPPANVVFIHGDISDPGVYGQLAGYRFAGVFHLAASFANEKSVVRSEIDCKSNILGTVQLLTWLNSYDPDGGIPVIYTGSSSSYGNQPVPFTTDTPPNPSTPYGLSKLVGESYIKFLRKKYVIFRLFNVYGPGDIPGKWRNAIPNMTARAIKIGKIDVFGGNSSRDFTYVGDVVQVLYAAWERNIAVNCKTYNLCSGIESPMLLIAEWIGGILRLDSMDMRIDINVKSARSWDKVERRVGDATELLNDFGDILNTDGKLYERLGGTVRWIQEYCRKHEFYL